MRLISADGEQLGIKHIREAMDYGKFKYQKEQARKAARKNQVNVNVREIKLRPKIGYHDFNTKRGHVERFLRGGDKVKVTIMFRGREVQHPDLGERLLRRLATDLDDLGRIESQPNLDGRNMVMVMVPKKESIEAQQGGNAQQGERRERAARR